MLMSRNKIKSLFAVAGFGIFVSVGFQNCAGPSTEFSVAKSSVKKESCETSGTCNTTETEDFASITEPIVDDTETNVEETETENESEVRACKPAGTIAIAQQNCQGGEIPRTDLQSNTAEWSGCCSGNVARRCQVTGLSSANPITCL